jgi:hypothetical protein
VPVFQPAVAGFEQLFVLRGQEIEQLLFAGPPGMPKLLVAIAAANPKGIDGEIDEFEIELPTGRCPASLPAVQAARSCASACRSRPTRSRSSSPTAAAPSSSSSSHADPRSGSPRARNRADCSDNQATAIIA